MSDAYDDNEKYGKNSLPPPLTSGGRPVFEDREAFLRRFIMTEVLGPPLAHRKRQSAPPPPPVKEK